MTATGIARRIYGVVQAAFGFFASLYVAFVGIAPAPWSYAVLATTLLVLVGGLMVLANFRAREGSWIALVGASAFTASAATFALCSLYRMARGGAVDEGAALWFFGALILLTATVDWATYRAVCVTRRRA